MDRDHIWHHLALRHALICQPAEVDKIVAALDVAIEKHWQTISTLTC